MQVDAGSKEQRARDVSAGHPRDKNREENVIVTGFCRMLFLSYRAIINWPYHLAN
jgi:hypothetical protein